jgi:myo-inositol-1(or 4)-monophosphatase
LIQFLSWEEGSAMPPETPRLLAVAEQAARAGAQELQSWQGRFTARQKGRHDLVTDADLASELAVRTMIASQFPDHGILGEEAPDARQLEREYCWVVDPLDGTTNYAHGFPCYGVSVAVARQGRLLAGVVYDPVRDECFAAGAGLGARLNGAPISTTAATRVDEALVALSFPAHVTAESPDLVAMLRVMPLCQGMRRTGSAALNLSYVACGRLDAHWAHEINPWDSAAGVLIVQEAGGTATASDGTPYNLANGNYLTASTAELHAALAPLVRREAK